MAILTAQTSHSRKGQVYIKMLDDLPEILKNVTISSLLFPKNVF